MALRFASVRKAHRPVPDYANQLDLFSEAPIDTPAPTVLLPVHPSGASHGRPRPPKQLDFGALEPLPPEDAGGTPTRKPAAAGTGGDRGALQRLPVRDGVGEEDGIQPGLGTGDTGVPPAGRITLEVEPEDKPSRDFRITDAHRIGEGGLHEKAQGNIAAIRLLKKLEAENRDATDDEKAVLARYVGWGALANAVFGHYPSPEWRNTAGAVKELLTGDEYESARASTPNAHLPRLW
jgi:hypothetical protein